MERRVVIAGALLLFIYGCGSDDSNAGQSSNAQQQGDGGSGSDATTSQDGSSATGDGGSGGDGASSGGDSGSNKDSGASEGGVPTTGGIFVVPEPWTKDVSGLAKDPRSDAIIQALDSMGGWGNGNKLQIDFSIPLFFGDSSTPRMTVNGASGYYLPDSDPVPFQMPIPASSNIEGSTNLVCDTANSDCHILVVEKTQKKLYELYNATQSGGGITALGGFIWDLTKAYPDSERGDQCTSADAAGFPIAGLLPTADEVAAGTVAHALRFILPNARMKKAVYVHPASHAGGPSSTNANAPPYGVRFRLKATFDETPFNAGEKVILHALKKYGMLLSDGGNIALTFADDRTTTAKWATVGVTAQSFNAITPDNFEVVDLSSEIAVTDNCVRNP